MKSKPRLAVALWLTIIQTILMRYIKIDPEWVEKVRAAAAKGHLVFVLRNRSLIDFICLRGLCQKYDLPRVAFVSGLAPFFYVPIWRLVLNPFRRRNHREQRRRMKEVLAQGGSAVVFLRKPARRGAFGSQPVKFDGVRMAVEIQPELERPVIALPAVFLWGELAMNRFPGTIDFLLGSNEYPRLQRSIWLLLRHRSIHQMLLGEPLNIAGIREERNLDEDALTGVLRAGVGRQIETIRRSKLGSLTKPSARLKNEVMRSPRLRAELAAIGAKANLSQREIEKRTEAIVNKLATDFRPRVLALFALVMAFVWKRIYTGIEVDQAEMERLRTVLAGGPTLILPTHKSHIDYLVISQVMQDQNTMLPHIAAGENLSFWPLGWLFKSSGAFFIRRRFMHDPFYTAIVNAYLRHLLQEKYAIEIFIEGTRSRTGKLLRPKLGMLDMALKALAVTPRMDLQILPVFIGYERVIEEREYVNEASGGSKTKESIRGLIKTTKVLLTRYGQLHVRIGESFSASAVLADLGLAQADLTKSAARREVADEIALRDFHEIQRITVVTPSAVFATVLLTNRKPSLAHDELRYWVLWLVDFLKSAGASLSPFMAKWQEIDADSVTGEDLLDRTAAVFAQGMQLHVDDKGPHPVYRVRKEQRLPLDYYKNNILHFLVPASLVSTSCLVAGGQADRDQVVRNLGQLCQLFHWEFMLRTDRPAGGEPSRKEAEKLLARALEPLVKHKVVEEEGDRLIIRDRDKALFLSDLLTGFHEVYFAALAAAKEKAAIRESGDSAEQTTSVLEHFIWVKQFSRPEAHIKINMQTAMQALRDSKIVTAKTDENSFSSGNIGDILYRYLEAAIRLE